MSWPLHAYPRVSGEPVALGEGCGYSTHTFQSTDVYLYVCMCVPVCVFVLVCVYVLVCVCMSVCDCVCVSVSVLPPLECVGVHLCPHVNMMYMCVCVPAYMPVNVCVVFE